MLSMKLIESPSMAVSYYEKDDYYTAGQEDLKAAGEWYGQGFDRLNLVHLVGQPVDREDFKKLLEGELPERDPLGRVIGGERVHTPGWDLTFSAPKSVSILAEIGGDERLREAHQDAIKQTLTWLESEVIAYRQSGPGGVEPHRSGNLLAALFQHATSREKDPQLHTHCVILNATERADGQWASIHSKPIFDAKMLAGTVYRSELALRVQALGYAIEKTHADGRFELTDTPAALREVFQSRRDQIAQAMQQRGLSDAESAAEMALRTRKSKQAHPREALMSLWTQKTRDAGFDPALMVDAARAAGAVTPKLKSAEQAVKAAVDRLSEAEAVFHTTDLLRWSLAGAVGYYRIGDIRAAIEREKTGGRLQETTLNGRSAFTTLQARELERRLLDNARRGRGKVLAIDPSSTFNSQLERSTLDAGQRAAVALIATTTDRIIGVQGRAGTGKTFMLGFARERLEAKGFEVHGMAQNSEAARTLQEGSGIASGTLRRHMNTVRKDLNGLAGNDADARVKIRATYAKQVWVLDEAGQVGVQDMQQLTVAAERLGARLVLVGDTRQLGAIDAGKPFAQLLADGMPSAHMDKIRRQQNPAQRQAIDQVYAGDLRAALSTLSPNVREIGDAETRMAGIVEAWKALGAQRSEAVILTAGNREKAQLTEAVRQVLREEGKLDGEREQRQLVRVFSRNADRIDAGFYKVGDTVRFPRRLASLGIARGDYLRVAAVDKTRNLVTLAPNIGDNRRIDWNPDRIAGAGQHAVEVYRERETTLAPGEQIRWTRNSPEQGLTNGLRLTVTAVGTHSIKARTSRGDTVSIDTATLSGRHWEHGVVSTVYSAQGSTARHLLVNAQSDKGELFSQKAFLVAISRQQESLKLYTDDNAKLLKSLERHAGEKTSAIELVSKTQHLQGERPAPASEPLSLERRLERILEHVDRLHLKDEDDSMVRGRGERSSVRSQDLER